MSDYGRRMSANNDGMDPDWKPDFTQINKSYRDRLEDENKNLKEKLNIALEALLKMRGYGYNGHLPVDEAIAKINEMGQL